MSFDWWSIGETIKTFYKLLSFNELYFNCSFCQTFIFGCFFRFLVFNFEPLTSKNNYFQFVHCIKHSNSQLLVLGAAAIRSFWLWNTFFFSANDLDSSFSGFRQQLMKAKKKNPRTTTENWRRLPGARGCRFTGLRRSGTIQHSWNTLLWKWSCCTQLTQQRTAWSHANGLKAKRVDWGWAKVFKVQYFVQSAAFSRCLG